MNLKRVFFMIVPVMMSYKTAHLSNSFVSKSCMRGTILTDKLR